MKPSTVARLDHERHDRTGVPEVVLASGKTLEQNAALVRGLYERADFALATRVPHEQRDALVAACPGSQLEPLSGTLRWGGLPRTGMRVAVVCAGTSDLPVAEEAAFTLDALGSKAHGYVARPAKEGKYPALIQLQYAGVYALNAAQEARFTYVQATIG